MSAVDVVAITRTPRVVSTCVKQQPDPAGRGMHQRRLARLRGIRRAGQVLRGQALEEDRARSLIVDAVGHRDGALGRHDDLRGVPGTGDHRPPDVVTFTHLTTGDAGADGAHDPRALGADDERGRERVGAGAVVDVDDVDPRRGHVDAQLTRAGSGQGRSWVTSTSGQPGSWTSTARMRAS